MTESKLFKVIIFIIATNVNVINENNSVEDIAITLDELLCKKNEKDLIDLLKTLNLYKTIEIEGRERVWTANFSFKKPFECSLLWSEPWCAVSNVQAQFSV